MSKKSKYKDDQQRQSNTTSPLIQAIQTGNSEKVLAEINKNLEGINEKSSIGSTPLHIAAGCGRLPVIKVLVENGAQINATNNDDMTPLHYAIIGGSNKEKPEATTEICKYLVENKADIHVKDSEGFSPLNSAMKFNRELATVLMEAGATADKKYNDSLMRNYVESGVDIEENAKVVVGNLEED